MLATKEISLINSGKTAYIPSLPKHYTDYSQPWSQPLPDPSAWLVTMSRIQKIRAISIAKAWATFMEASGSVDELSQQYAHAQRNANPSAPKSRRLYAQLPRKISEAISEAKELLKFKDDWDEEGALATDKATLSKTLSILRNHARHLLAEHGKTLPAPYIDIMRDGSISMYWETNVAKLFIIIKKGDIPNSFYYGERKDNHIPLKSAIAITDGIDDSLALWMKKNLC